VNFLVDFLFFLHFSQVFEIKIQTNYNMLRGGSRKGNGTVSAKTLILACGKFMKYKWTITKKVMILLTSQDFIYNFSKIRGQWPLP
jgi:hypothetical protein